MQKIRIKQLKKAIKQCTNYKPVLFYDERYMALRKKPIIRAYKTIYLKTPENIRIGKWPF